MISKTTPLSFHNITTAEQLLAMPSDDNRYELLQGVLIMMSPAGSEHGRVAGRILRRLGDHVEAHKLGETYAAETGFRISHNPDTVPAPDAAFVSSDQLKDLDSAQGFLPLAPDLVVEVISPNDSFSDVESSFRFLPIPRSIVQSSAPVRRAGDSAPDTVHLNLIYTFSA